MALPLLFLVPAAASGIYGLVKGGKAVADNSKAKDINESADRILRDAKELLEDQRANTNKILEDYGSRKLRAFDGVIKSFIDNFGKLKNVELSNSPELDKLQSGTSPIESINLLTKDYNMIKSSGLGIASGVTGGAAVAFGAYNGTMLLASAGTGTAISTLSGAAATNATLAWLGGGTLASGGAGIAGGMMVLGGLVAGPALAITGFIMGNKASEALSNAKSNKEKALSVYEESETIAEGLKAIDSVATYANNIFSKLSSKLRYAVKELEKVISSTGTDYSKYNKQEKEIVFKSVKFAQLVQAMINTPIMDENGSLILTSKERFEEIAQSL